MIKNMRALAYYLELRDSTEASICSYVSDKIRLGWAKLTPGARVQTGQKTQIIQATGSLNDAGNLTWDDIFIGGLRTKDIPDSVLDCLNATSLDGSIWSPKDYVETLNNLVNKPTSHYQVTPSPRGFTVIFRAKCPTYAYSHSYVTLGKDDHTEILTFPFTEDAWDATLKELRFS